MRTRITLKDFIEELEKHPEFMSMNIRSIGAAVSNGNSYLTVYLDNKDGLQKRILINEEKRTEARK